MHMVAHTAYLDGCTMHMVDHTVHRVGWLHMGSMRQENKKYTKGRGQKKKFGIFQTLVGGWIWKR